VVLYTFFFILSVEFNPEFNIGLPDLIFLSLSALHRKQHYVVKRTNKDTIKTFYLHGH
jgi:hypothetical protein